MGTPYPFTKRGAMNLVSDFFTMCAMFRRGKTILVRCLRFRCFLLL